MITVCPGYRDSIYEYLIRIDGVEMKVYYFDRVYKDDNGDYVIVDGKPIFYIVDKNEYDRIKEEWLNID